MTFGVRAVSSDASRGTKTETRQVNDPGKDLQFLLALALDKSLEGRRALTTTIGDLFTEQDKILTERERALGQDLHRRRTCHGIRKRQVKARPTWGTKRGGAGREASGKPVDGPR